MSIKKFIVPIIIAAVLGVGAGAATVIMNKQANAGLLSVTELECGTYYLNGDKNSDLWLEVNPDFLIVKGNDVDSSLKTAITVKFHDLDPNASHDEDTQKMLDTEFEECKLLYFTEKIYMVKEFIPEQSKSLIAISRDNTDTYDKLEFSDAAFIYNYAEKSIHTGLFGDFILVED